jgi:glycosyltransferase involved in cell wall biosynthesis
LVGTNINKNKILIEQIRKLKLRNYVKLLGPMKNISIIMNSIDIHVQSSKSEGFPNVIAEAMAHKTPCVATRVGDTPYIMGKNGWLVKPKNPTKLAIALERALDEIQGNNWNKRCNMARTIIKKKFGIKKMINSYNQIWLKVYKKNKID